MAQSANNQKSVKAFDIFRTVCYKRIKL